MSKLKLIAKRGANVANALVLLAATLGPSLVFHGTANAAGQVQTRKIQMSSSTGDATGVSYSVSFKWATTGNVGGVVLDFCDNSPIIGDTTCTTPPGTFSTGTTVTGLSTDLSTFTASNLNSGRTFVLSAATPVSMTSGNTATFTMTNVRNPLTQNHTFYARLYTYATNTAATSYTVATPGSYIDYGGFALSTAQAITVTAKVQEQLSFCVYTGANCGAGGSAVNLGDANGVLALYNQNYTDASTKFDISTNAQTGAIVNLKMATLASGGNTIAAQGATCTADSTNTSVAQFGIRISAVTAPVAAVAPYNCTATNHTLDTNGTTGTTSTYGQTIANTSGSPLSTTTGTVEFAAKAALTTPAGIYTTTANFIATGTF